MNTHKECLLKKNLLTPDHFQSLDNEKWCHELFKTLPNAGGIVQKTWVPFNIMQWGSDCLTHSQLDNYYGTSFNTTASESYLQCLLSILNKEPKVKEYIENLWTFFFFFGLCFAWESSIFSSESLKHIDLSLTHPSLSWWKRGQTGILVSSCKIYLWTGAQILMLDFPLRT